MSCGATQNLSASVGCPPYTWSLSGGGTLTPSGGDNTSATYVAPASNPYCANNPTIILTDSCRNISKLQLAITNPSISGQRCGYYIRLEPHWQCTAWAIPLESNVHVPVSGWGNWTSILYCDGYLTPEQESDAEEIIYGYSPPTNPPMNPFY